MTRQLAGYSQYYANFNIFRRFALAISILFPLKKIFKIKRIARRQGRSVQCFKEKYRLIEFKLNLSKLKRTLAANIA